jgi:hypothetical protein
MLERSSLGSWPGTSPRLGVRLGLGDGDRLRVAAARGERQGKQVQLEEMRVVPQYLDLSATCVEERKDEQAKGSRTAGALAIEPPWGAL